MMALVPIIPNLIQDMTPVIYQYIDGPSKYRLSMTSHEWHMFCINNVVPITSYESMANATNQLDILRIIMYYNWDMTKLFYHICRVGNMEIINIALKKGNQAWNSGLKGACVGGHIELAKFMIAKGANKFDLTMFDACEHGHANVVQYLIDNGANNYHSGLYFACKGDHVATIELMIEKSFRVIMRIPLFGTMD